MKFLALIIMMSGVAQAADKPVPPKDIEVCTQVSKKDEAYYCDFGSFVAVHFKGQAPFTVNKAAPAATPAAK